MSPAKFSRMRIPVWRDFTKTIPAKPFVPGSMASLAICWAIPGAMPTVIPPRPSIPHFILQASDQSIEELVVQDEEAELLFTLMASLPADQRECYLELRLAGLSAAEIGVVLGRSPDAVRKAQSRVFAAMRSTAETMTPESGGRHG